MNRTKGNIMEWNDLEQAAPSIDSLLKDRGGFLFEEQTDAFRPVLESNMDDWNEDDWTDEPLLDD
jgi:hypothetical protein